MITPTTVAELVSSIDQGFKAKYVFFWGHTPKRAGDVDATCLSQWAPTPFTLDGTTFATAEHYMMWSKAHLFADTEAAARILTAGHPKQAKDIGGQVRDFTEETWRTHRTDIVTRGTLAKFTQHPALGAYLLGTGTRILVEASPLDRVWGIGLAADDPRAADPDHWRGLNLLGFALMRARDILRTADHPAESTT